MEYKEELIMHKKRTAALLALLMAVSMTACAAAGTSASAESEGLASKLGSALSESKETGETGAATENTPAANTAQEDGTVVAIADVTADGAIDATDLFSNRDLRQEADISDAVYINVSDGEDVTIEEAGVYVLSGTAKEVTVTVYATDDAKVQLVLDGLTIVNANIPCFYVKNADKVFITTAEGSENTLTVTGDFTADGNTKTDASIFAKDDLTLNGLGTLTIQSSDNGISSKDDLKITGGTLNITAADCGLEANDSIAVAGGTITVAAGNDGLHAENDDDNTLGYIYICGGTLSVQAGDDGIHATTIAQIDGGEINVTAEEGLEATWVQVNGGSIRITASDDGVNAARKSTAYSVLFEMNGGELTIDMGQGDTDGIDSNGDLYINGGTVNITGQSPFDYDGAAQYNGGTILVNGVETNTITNQFMGGMGGFGGPGGMGGGSGGFGGNGGWGGGFGGGHH